MTHDVVFVPFCVEVGGAWGSAANNFFNTCVELASDDRDIYRPRTAGRSTLARKYVRPKVVEGTAMALPVTDLNGDRQRLLVVVNGLAVLVLPVRYLFSGENRTLGMM